MAVLFASGHCIACKRFIPCFNPHHVPSLVVLGLREPLCESCFHRWNEIHRTRKGQKPIPLHPQAYQPAEEV